MLVAFDSKGHETGYVNVTILTGETFTYTDETTQEEKTMTFSPRVLDPIRECRNCGQYPHIDFDIETERAWAKDPCTHPNGIVTTIRLNVPSGKLVVDDDLRDVYNCGDEGTFASYNSLLGQAQVIEAMAKDGCAYGPVGNSCPGLYDQGDGNYVIATPGYIEGKWDEEAAEYLTDDEEIPVPGNRLAGIVTDLWAYSMADYDDFLSKGGDLDKPCREVIVIPPGVYEFTHLTGEPGFDGWSSGIVTYARVRRISD